MNYKVIKQNMDLIQIYKKGELNTVKYYYKNQNEIGERWAFLVKHFLDYFPEAMEGASTTEEIVTKRKNIYADHYYEEFNNMFEMVGHGPKNPRTGRKKMRPDQITDKIGQEFFDKYFGRFSKTISIKTTKEEAEASGIKEVIEFRKSYDDLIEKKCQKQNEKINKERKKVAEATKENREKSNILLNTYDIMNKLEEIAKNHNASVEYLIEISGIQIENGYSNKLYALAKEIDNICYLSSDQAYGLFKQFKDKIDLSKIKEKQEFNFQLLLNICNAFDVPLDYFWFKTEVSS